MDASDIVRLLYTTHYSPADLEEVNKICRTFPEFSSAQLLRIRIMEVLGREKQQQLKLAAVYSMNREKLYQLVNEVKPEPEPEEAAEAETEVIQFSEEPHEEADVIIRHHAPYAGEETDTELLELDEEPDERLLTLDEDTEKDEDTEEDGDTEEDEDTDEDEDTEEDGDTGDDGRETGEEEDINPSSLLYDIEKDESDMEEPKVDDEEIPVIDQVDRPQNDQNHHLISRFIKEDPGPIRPDRETSLKGDVSLDSIREHDGFITDTLAKIYVKQGLYAKAIYAYERLSLKYPEKSAYFAAQIEKIRNINHS